MSSLGRYMVDAVVLEHLRCAEIASKYYEWWLPNLTRTVSVGNDRKLEVAKLARLPPALRSTRPSMCCCGWRSA